MRQRADTDKKEAVLAEATMSAIEAAAQRQYKKDLAAAEAVKSSHGDWVRLLCPSLLIASLQQQPACSNSHHSGLPVITTCLTFQVLDEDSGHYYNSAQRYYFSRCALTSITDGLGCANNAYRTEFQNT